MKSELFYKTLGKFKLGNSDAYDVALIKVLMQDFVKNIRFLKILLMEFLLIN